MVPFWSLSLDQGIFKTWIHICHHSLAFSNLAFSCAILFASLTVCSLQHLLRHPLFFFFCMLFIYSVIPLCSFLLHILLQNCFVSFASNCWVPFMYSPSLVRRFFSLLWNVLVLFVLFDSVLVPFESPFFRHYHLIYFFKFYSQSCQRLSFWVIFFRLVSCMFHILLYTPYSFSYSYLSGQILRSSI